MSQAETSKDNSRLQVNRPPALDPERPELVMPWRQFASEGLIEKLVFERTPMGTSCVVHVNPILLGLREDQKEVSPGVAKKAIIDKELWTPKGKKATGSKTAKDALPKKSISLKDFEGSDSNLLNRANAVANVLGNDTARGRIGSMGLQLPGVDDFNVWWNRSNGAQKARLLTDMKKFEELNEEHFDRITRVVVKCPFRGAVPPQEEKSSKEKEEEPEQKKSSAKEKGKSKPGPSKPATIKK
jgi:hypothetical protein